MVFTTETNNIVPKKNCMDTPDNQNLVLLIVLLIAVVPGVFFVRTLRDTLRQIEPGNRTMKPGKAWLLLIPFFNYIWLFVVVKAIATSLVLQYKTYRVFRGNLPTYNTGLALCLCTAGCLIPRLNVLLCLPVLVLWVLYWVKVNAKRKELIHLKNSTGAAVEGSIFSSAGFSSAN